MSLQSMTGFARREGTTGRYRWAWELRSVNGKGLDLRLRLPPGFEALEIEARRQLSERFSRGNMQVGLSVSAADAPLSAVINRDALDALLALRTELGDLVDPAPLRFESLLSIRGIVDFREAQDDPALAEERDAAILAGLGGAIDDLAEMRRREGVALAGLLEGQIGRIAALKETVERDPARQPDEIARRLATQVAMLVEAAPSLDRDRLHQEAVILATKADLREEIDRLAAHVAAARELIAAGGPVGRKLDFLAQEFNRESNTICSKSTSQAVTAAGIELKVVIDQFREQVQNLE